MSDKKIEKSPIQITIDKWIEGWNSHDIQKIMETYADQPEIFDQKIKEVFPQKNDFKLENKDEIRQYFQAILDTYPNIQVKPHGLWLKFNEALLEYYLYLTEDSYVDMISKFYLNKQNKIQGQFDYYGLGYKEAKKKE